MSEQTTPEIKTDQFSPDEGVENVNPFKSNGNVSEKNLIHDTKANTGEQNTVVDGNDHNIVSGDYDNKDNFSADIEIDDGIVSEDHDNKNNVSVDHEIDDGVAGDDDKDTVAEERDSANAYYVTDEEDIAFPFMKLFSCMGKKAKKKDKTCKKLTKDKAKEPLIDPFRQTHWKLLNTKCEHGVIPSHPYIQTISGGDGHSSSVTGAPTDTLMQSEKTYPVNISTGNRPVKESRGREHLDSNKDVSHNTCIDDFIYDFSHPHRGYAIVIVNQYFKMLYPRNGAEVDVSKTRIILRKLGYLNKNIERQNLDKESTLAILQDAKDSDHSKMDSFALIISSHGNEIESPRNGKKEHAIYCSDDQYIFTSDILEMFNDENCPSLKGKPKLFFIQACRGTNVDCGAKIEITVDDRNHFQEHSDGHKSRFSSHYDGKSPDGETVEPVMNPESQSDLNLGHVQSVDDTDARGFDDVFEDKPIVHCNNDCLVMYAIPSGYFAWRSNDDGSWMLHYLWEEVMKYDYRKPCSFLKVLTAVNLKMANRETFVPDNPLKSGKKAISVIIHQLDKDIVFQQKTEKYVECTKATVISRNESP